MVWTFFFSTCSQALCLLPPIGYSAVCQRRSRLLETKVEAACFLPKLVSSATLFGLSWHSPDPRRRETGLPSPCEECQGCVAIIDLPQPQKHHLPHDQHQLDMFQLVISLVYITTNFKEYHADILLSIQALGAEAGGS